MISETLQMKTTFPHIRLGLHKWDLLKARYRQLTHQHTNPRKTVYLVYYHALAENNKRYYTETTGIPAKLPDSIS